MTWCYREIQPGASRGGVGEGRGGRGGGKNKRSNPLLSVHLAPLRPAFLFFRSGMMESREGSTADSLLRARFWGSRHSASLMVTQEELFQLLFRGEKEGKEKSGFLATKAGKLSESQSLVVLHAFVWRTRSELQNERRNVFSFRLIPQMLMVFDGEMSL